jgi:hypothetical protein
MNKIKNVFHRPQKIKSIDERRPQQFVKRQSSQATAAKRDEPTSSPAIGFMELSEMEKPAYSSWWKDLDPFDLERIDNQTVLKFLNGCHLEDSKLEQVGIYINMDERTTPNNGYLYYSIILVDFGSI